MERVHIAWARGDGGPVSVERYESWPKTPGLRPRLSCLGCNGAVSLVAGRNTQLHFRHLGRPDCPLVDDAGPALLQALVHLHQVLREAAIVQVRRRCDSRHGALESPLPGMFCPEATDENVAYDAVEIAAAVGRTDVDVVLRREGRIVLRIIPTLAPLGTVPGTRREAWIEVRIDPGNLASLLSWQASAPLAAARSDRGWRCENHRG